MKADAVFEGGGVKGIALIGAISVMEEKGYSWEKVAGSSAGAIVAALLAAGYNSREMSEIFKKLNYLSFLKKRGISAIPYVGTVYDMLVKFGVYPGDPIEKFIHELLHKKGIRTFGDIPPDKLRIIASDISDGTMLVLPDSLNNFGIDPATFPIARAARMSSSIPYFYQPYKLKQGGVSHLIVDGGLLSNFPVWLFDVTGKPRWPTFGFRLSSKESQRGPSNKINGILSYTKALINTMLDAHDRFYVSKAHAVRTIFVPTNDVRVTQFNLSDQKKMELYESGRLAAFRFLESWDFEAYISDFRTPVYLG